MELTRLRRARSPASRIRSAPLPAGIVVRPCANWVQIKHGNGWETSYYHLIHIKVSAGQYVKQGALLGYTSTQAGCGGSATGPHVHFSIKHDGKYVDVGGFVLGGWTVSDGGPSTWAASSEATSDAALLAATSSTTASASARLTRSASALLWRV